MTHTTQKLTPAYHPPLYGLTPDCPIGFSEAQLRISGAIIFIIYYKQEEESGTIDEWYIYLKGSDVDLVEFVSGNMPMYLQCVQAVSQDSGVYASTLGSGAETSKQLKGW